jgi:hypothetical protein
MYFGFGQARQFFLCDPSHSMVHLVCRSFVWKHRQMLLTRIKLLFTLKVSKRKKSRIPTARRTLLYRPNSEKVKSSLRYFFVFLINFFYKTRRLYAHIHPPHSKSIQTEFDFETFFKEKYITTNQWRRYNIISDVNWNHWNL